MFKDEICDLVQIDLARVRKIRAALVAPEAVQGLAETFSALGDPTRVRILDALSHGELCVCDLAAVLGLSQSAVSHQLRLLRTIRLVRPRRDGRIVFYSLDDQHIMSIFKQTLQHVEEEQRQPAAAKTPSREGAMSSDERQSHAAHIAERMSAAITAKPTRLRRPARGCADGLPRSRRSWRSPAVPLAWSRLRPGGLTGCWSSPRIVGSVFPAQRAWQSIKRFSLDINVLMVIAVMGAMAIGEYEEAAMVVTLFAAAQWLEAQSLDRARQAIGRLLNLAPSDVLVRDDAGERLIDIELVTPGALMIVRPGEKFALDGIVRTRALGCEPGADYR